MRRSLPTIVLILTILVAACGSFSPQGQLEPTLSITTPFSPTPTITPTHTFTLEPTFTPTVTATPQLPVIPGTQIPVSNISLSPDNIDQVVELARWGKGFITDAVYSPDGDLIAVATTLGVSIYGAETLEKKLEFETGGSINSLAYSPDGNLLAAGLTNGSIEIWNVADGTLLIIIENQEKESDVFVISVSFSPDGNLLASGLSNGYINLWRVSDGTLALRPDKKQGFGISSVFFSPDGVSVFSSAYDGTINMRNVSDGKTVRGFKGTAIIDAILSADGNILAAYDLHYSEENSNLIIWDVKTGKRLQTIPTGINYSPTSTTLNIIVSVALSPDAQLLAAAWQDHTVKVWDINSGVLQYSLEDLQPENGWYDLYIFTTTFSPVGNSLLLAGADSIGLWNVENGNLLTKAIVKSDVYKNIALSPDGQVLGVVEGPNVYLMQMSDGNLVPVQDTIQSSNDVLFLPDGHTLAVSMFDYTVQLWPASDLGIRKTFEMEEKDYYNIKFVAVSPDGKYLAMGGNSPSGLVELRQISDGILITSIGLGSDSITDLAFSKSGDILVVSGTKQIQIIRVPEGRYPRSFPNMTGKSALSPDGTLLAGTYEETSLRVWYYRAEDFQGNIYTQTPTPFYTIKGLTAAIGSILFSPDGSMLAIGYSNGMIEIRLVEGGVLLKSWQGHASSVSDIVFTTDGSKFITASYDGTIRVWGIKP